MIGSFLFLIQLHVYYYKGFKQNAANKRVVMSKIALPSYAEQME